MDKIKDEIKLLENEALVVVIRHPKHQKNQICDAEAERVRAQGRRLGRMGLRFDEIASVIASIRGRSQETAELLIEGLDGFFDEHLPLTISHAYDALDEIGDRAKAFKAKAIAEGMKPWEALAEQRGAELCKQYGITDRLVRATQFWTVCQTSAQLAGPGKAVVVSGHNGNNIELAIELAKLQTQGIRTWSPDQIPTPTRYVWEAGLVLLYVDAKTSLLTRDPVYLDAA